MNVAPPQMIVVRPLLPSLAEVDNPVERQAFWEDFCDSISAQHDRTPGCQPLSLSRKMLGRVLENDYAVTLKSDGVRFVLFLTTRSSSPPGAPQPVALMIERSGIMFEVEVVAVADAFEKKTVLEGELVWRQPHEESMLFLVFDCLLSSGRLMLREPFRVRRAELERLTRYSEDVDQSDDVEQQVDETQSIVLSQYTPRVRMRSKTFVERRFASTLWDQRSEVDHRVDGIVLQDQNAVYRFGTAYDGSILKWKMFATVDLQGGTAPDRLPRTADGPLPALVHGRRFTVRTDSRIRPETEDTIVEYLVTTDECLVTLFAMRVRQDKERANSLRVVEATVHDVLEAITPAEIGAEALVV